MFVWDKAVIRLCRGLIVFNGGGKHKISEDNVDDIMNWGLVFVIVLCIGLVSFIFWKLWKRR